MVIVNMCGFIDEVKEELVEMIFEVVEVKGDGCVWKLFVVGCMVNCYVEEFVVEIFEIDGFVGFDDFIKVGDLVVFGFFVVFVLS